MDDHEPAVLRQVLAFLANQHEAAAAAVAKWLATCAEAAERHQEDALALAMRKAQGHLNALIVQRQMDRLSGRDP